MFSEGFACYHLPIQPVVAYYIVHEAVALIFFKSLNGGGDVILGNGGKMLKVALDLLFVSIRLGGEGEKEGARGSERDGDGDGDTQRHRHERMMLPRVQEEKYSCANTSSRTSLGEQA